MKRLDGRVFGGALLIIGGILLLLQKMIPGFLEIDNAPEMYVGIGFWIGALIFLFYFLRGEWWAAIPGTILAGIGTALAFADALGEWFPTVIVGSIGLSFLLVYLARRDFWWALIPGGTLISIGLGVGIEANTGGGLAFTSTFFFGLGVTFALVALLGRQKWAWWPAGILAVLGVPFLFTFDFFDYVQAAVLIAGGLLLIYYALRKNKA